MKAGALIPGTLDRYLLRLMLPRMGMALLVAMGALLIERMLRLFDIITGAGAGLGPLLGMLASLLPHYLGLALPLAFCIGTLGVLSSLAQANEIDVLEGSGWSIRRVGAVFVLSGVLLAMLSIALFGYIQPYSRYAYREMNYALRAAGWDGRVEQNVFVRVGDSLVLSAEEIDPTGRRLARVFAVQNRDGREVVTTARRAVVVPAPERGAVGLVLLDGVSMLPRGDKLVFDELRLQHEFDLADNPFRPRGGSERELTLNELAVRMRGEDGLPTEPRYAAELHSRVVRALSLVAVALLAVPLGVAHKRSPTWPRIAVAIAVLVGFHHALQFGESLAQVGRLDPALAVWGPGGAFFALALWLYMSTVGQGAPSALRGVLRWIEDRRPRGWPRGWPRFRRRAPAGGGDGGEGGR